MIDDPFPIPREVICSPNHITIIVLQQNTKHAIKRNSKPGNITISDVSFINSSAVANPYP